MTPADPIKYDALRVRIQDQMITQRHTDAERHSEARAGGNITREAIADYPAGRSAETVAFWTRIEREDRAADLAGIPDPTDCPILRAAHVSAD